MNYENVKIWNRKGDLMLQKGKAVEGNGILKVEGKMEQGMSFTSGQKYRCEADPNFSKAIFYIDALGGVFRFKID